MKVGIITFYHKSSNYGGVLQAYALCVIANRQIDAQQILYSKGLKASNITLKNLKTMLKRFLSKFLRKRCNKTLKNRQLSFELFQSVVPHSNIEYDAQTIVNSLDVYDIFITGSDQVWNVAYYDDIYRLDFVPPTKYKFSYAAGVSSGVLTKEQQEIFRKSLSTFDAISVREESAVKTLQPLTDKKVEWVLDPTLLLSPEDWNQICPPRRVAEKYVFCYFLGELALSNKKIIEFAHSKNLKVVSMPYLARTSRKDSDFGDYKIYDAPPPDFISLIKNAEYVFTDSFHATVFSHIYHKNFFVFNRAGLKSMNDRIYSLISLFNTQDRFCDTKAKISLKYIESLPPIDYNKEFLKFEEQKEKSIKFLRENLGKAKQKLKND